MKLAFYLAAAAMVAVALLLLLVNDYLLQSFQVGMGLRVLSTIGLVVLPTLALVLYRMGLLPPERVEVDRP